MQSHILDQWVSVHYLMRISFMIILMCGKISIFSLIRDYTDPMHLNVRDHPKTTWDRCQMIYKPVLLLYVKIIWTIFWHRVFYIPTANTVFHSLLWERQRPYLSGLSSSWHVALARLDYYQTHLIFQLQHSISQDTDLLHSDIWSIFRPWL